MTTERSARIAPRGAGPSRIERLLLVATPAAAMLAVALGLRLGASSTFQAAVVYAAPQADAKTGLAWQLLTFREGRGGREAVSISDLRLVARAAAKEVHWQGATNEDGVAEVLLPLPSEDGVHLEVTSGATLLAAGEARSPPPLERSPTVSTWARFARRGGPIALDVAVSGQRVASGFPASIWVRASDSASSVPLAGIAIEPEADTSFRPALLSARTDARGWAEIIGTPVGHVVSMTLHARAVDGRQGLWIGGLFVSPGAAHLHVRQRFAPDEEPMVDVVAPSEHTTAAYLEIDDRRGRAWATDIKLSAEGGGLPRGTARVPRLAPGFYWAVYASDPEGAAHLGPGHWRDPLPSRPRMHRPWRSGRTLRSVRLRSTAGRRRGSFPSASRSRRQPRCRGGWP